MCLHLVSVGRRGPDGLVGDGGAFWQVGVVESINPLSTVIRNDRSMPVAIPNRLLAEMIICNESQVEVGCP